MLADLGVHGVLIILPPPPMYSAESVVEALVPIIRNTSKPVVIALLGENLVRRAAEVLRAACIPDYRFPERAASALATLVHRAETLARPPASPVVFDDVYTKTARNLLAGHVDGSSEYISHAEASRLLEAYRIRAPQIELARTAHEAVALSALMGFPVALKVASPDISHKSDVGGVLLDVTDEEAVAKGFDTVYWNAKVRCPKAHLLGVHVQRMLPKGQEVIVGVVQDPQFGPLIMFGSGGVEVEGLHDVAFGLAPLSRDEAEFMLESTWAGRKLRGYRNLRPAAREAVLDVILRLGQLAADFPQLAEIEINPLRALPEGDGAVAVDVRAKVRVSPR